MPLLEYENDTTLSSDPSGKNWDPVVCGTSAAKSVDKRIARRRDRSLFHRLQMYFGTALQYRCRVPDTPNESFGRANTWSHLEATTARCYTILGSSPDRSWTAKVRLKTCIGDWAVPPSGADFKIHVRLGELCAYRLDKLVASVELFPSSYNKLLLQGSADYCRRVLGGLNEGREEYRGLIDQIRAFTRQLEKLRDQFSGRYAEAFALLDLQIVEDRFELVQSESARLGVLPHLRDIPTAELVDR
jgi:hypothetical protein